MIFFLDDPSACGGSSGTPTTAAPSPTTTAPCPGPLNWIGDMFCDDELNNAACEYDKGDCCDNDFVWWDIYCTVSTFL